MANLKEKYEVLCEMYVEAFLRKHGLFDDETGEYCDYDWIGDDVGGILEACDYSIGFNDIRYDIDNALHKDTYFEYYDYCIEHCDEERKINYHSYVKGFRFDKQDKEDKMEKIIYNWLSKHKVSDLTYQTICRKCLYTYGIVLNNANKSKRQHSVYADFDRFISENKSKFKVVKPKNIEDIDVKLWLNAVNERIDETFTFNEYRVLCLANEVFLKAQKRVQKALMKDFDEAKRKYYRQIKGS